MPYFSDADARAIISTTYAAAAPVAADVARTLYRPHELAAVPSEVIRWAFGVGNPVRHAALRRGDVVLDVGCGAGLDALLAAAQIGHRGRVIGLDMTPAMLERACRHAAAMQIDNVEWREGLMEALPLPDASVDVVLCNGVLNLSTRKSRALAEMHRVLRTGGRLALADLVLTEALPEEVQRDATALAVWLAGALAEPVLRRKLVNVGFTRVTVRERRPFGLAALERYRIFPPEFLDFVRRVVPPARHDSLVYAVDMTATTAVWQEERPMAVDTTALRHAIARVYTDVVTDPKKGYHFHTGPDYAVERLGYAPGDVGDLPDSVTAPFAGVGNPLSLGHPQPGQTVVDIGAGSGMDTFLAAKAVGPGGRVIAVDMTDAMLERGRDNIAATGLRQVDYRAGLAESLPVEDASADVVISNGVINLAPDKDAVFREAFRVLRPGGRLQIADIVVHKDIPPAGREDIDIWTAWIGGALLEGEYIAKIRQAGFVDVEIAWRGWPFSGAAGERRAGKFETEGVNIRARKP